MVSLNIVSEGVVAYATFLPSEASKKCYCTSIIMTVKLVGCIYDVPTVCRNSSVKIVSEGSTHDDTPPFIFRKVVVVVHTGPGGR